MFMIDESIFVLRHYSIKLLARTSPDLTSTRKKEILLTSKLKELLCVQFCTISSARKLYKIGYLKRSVLNQLE